MGSRQDASVLRCGLGATMCSVLVCKKQGTAVVGCLPARQCVCLHRAPAKRAACERACAVVDDCTYIIIEDKTPLCSFRFRVLYRFFCHVPDHRVLYCFFCHVPGRTLCPFAQPWWHRAQACFLWQNTLMRHMHGQNCVSSLYNQLNCNTVN